MSTITFKCETVTPMFMAGADGKEPELRAPSIKGVLRFWWRAINGYLELKDLREREAAIFGGSGKEQGRSKVIINIDQTNLDYEDYNPLPHRKNSNFKLKAFKSGQGFSVNLSLISDCIKVKENETFTFDNLCNLFIITTILGGFGKRSRRGFGSIRIIEPQKNVREINLSYILELLNSFGYIKYKIRDSEIYSDLTLNKGSLDYPYIKKIQIGRKYKTYNDLLFKIGMATHDFCDKILASSTSTGRMASPVYISIIKNADGYYPIITTLNTTVDKPLANISYSLKLQDKLKEAIL